MTRQILTKKIVSATSAFLLISSVAQAALAQKSVWTTINETAPRSVFDDIRDTAPRSVFDDIRDSAPVSPFDTLRDSAP